MGTSRIEWTNATWNPTTGCTKISTGCLNCYAERMAYRLQAMGQPNYKRGFKVECHPEMLQLPLKWKKPRLIFVNSMSDLFHELIPIDFIRLVFDTMNKAHWHIFQILTKRSERMRDMAHELNWTENIWAGVTVENNQCLYRVDDLISIPAATKFISAEPLIGPLHDLEPSVVDWIIVGGESGPGARPIRKDWVLDIRDKCLASGTNFFFKQWGGTNKKKTGRLLEGRTWDQLPAQI